MASPGYRDIFSCIACQMSGIGQAEFKCNGCGVYACEHLVVMDGGMMICFCCYKDQTIKWPDYSYTLVPEK